MDDMLGAERVSRQMGGRVNGGLHMCFVFCFHDVYFVEMDFYVTCL